MSLSPFLYLLHRIVHSLEKVGRVEKEEMDSNDH